MSLTDKFKSLLGVEAPRVFVELETQKVRQGETIRGRLLLQGIGVELLVQQIHFALEGADVCIPEKGAATPQCRPLTWDIPMEQPVPSQGQLEVPFTLPLPANARLFQQSAAGALQIRLEIPDAPAVEASVSLSLLPSRAIDALLKTLQEHFFVQPESVGTDLEADEPETDYPQCLYVSCVASERTESEFPRIAHLLDSFYLENLEAGLRVILAEYCEPEELEELRIRLQDQPAACTHSLQCHQEQGDLSFVLKNTDVWDRHNQPDTGRLAQVLGEVLGAVAAVEEELEPS